MRTRIFLNLLVLIALSILFSSCATMFGGTNYYARVQVPDHPDAKIEYKGSFKGTGEAHFKARRDEADSFSVTIKKDGCETQSAMFTQKSFRGWAFAGSLLGWTGVIPGTFIPLPWGLGVDGVTGAFWKPDVKEPGVTKEDFNNFVYQIDYAGCPEIIEPIQTKPFTNLESKADALRELKDLLDEEVITEEEFETEKNKILAN